MLAKLSRRLDGESARLAASVVASVSFAVATVSFAALTVTEPPRKSQPEGHHTLTVTAMFGANRHLRRNRLTQLQVGFVYPTFSWSACPVASPSPCVEEP